MAIRNPNLDEEIIVYDKLQTDEINTIKQSILTILSKLDLISDWVIESGSNADGTWEKWNSGKLVQKFNASYLTNSNGDVSITYPIPFVGSIPVPLVTLYNIGASRIYGVVMTPLLANFSHRISFQSGVPLANLNVGVKYVVEGRWK